MTDAVKLTSSIFRSMLCCNIYGCKNVSAYHCARVGRMAKMAAASLLSETIAVSRVSSTGAPPSTSSLAFSTLKVASIFRQETGAFLGLREDGARP